MGYAFGPLGSPNWASGGPFLVYAGATVPTRRIPKGFLREVFFRLRGTLSQKDLAYLLGSRYNVVAKWERGALKISWPEFVKLAIIANPRFPELTLHYFNLKPKAVSSAIGIVSAFFEREQENFHEKYGVSPLLLRRILAGRRNVWLDDVFQLFMAYSEINFMFLLQDLGLERSMVLRFYPDFARYVIYPSAGLDDPWIPLVLAALQLDGYRKLRAHVPGYFSKILGLSLEAEARIEALLKSKLIVIEDGRT